MTRKTKVEEWGLQDEVLELWNDGEGLSYQKIVDILEQKYGANLSTMAIKRFIDKYKRQDVESKYNEGKDVQAELYNTMIKKLEKLVTKLEEKADTYDMLLEEAIESRDFNRIMKLRKENREDIEQMRKNILSVIQYANTNIKPLQMLNQKNEIKINNLIIGFTSELCPVCRAKVKAKLEDLIVKR